MNRKALVFPLLILGIVGVYLWRGLSIDGTTMPSALIGKRVPAIELGGVPGYPGPFGREAFGGEVALVNIWGSWCVYCLYEHDVLLTIQSEGVPIYGIAWNDAPEDAAAWLERHGSPFAAVGLDPEGYAVAEFGVTGAPETFVIDKEGVVRYRYVGPISRRDWNRVLRPLIEELSGQEAAVTS